MHVSRSLAELESDVRLIHGCGHLGMYWIDSMIGLIDGRGGARRDGNGVEEAAGANPSRLEVSQLSNLNIN